MYTLKLTRKETDSVDFVGHRYSWSNALQDFLSYDDDGEPETLEMSERDAWALKEAFNEDTYGGHSMFPMLGPSTLRDKLVEFYDSVI
jgi:hypothetical protein